MIRLILFAFFSFFILDGLKSQGLLIGSDLSGRTTLYGGDRYTQQSYYLTTAPTLQVELPWGRIGFEARFQLIDPVFLFTGNDKNFQEYYLENQLSIFGSYFFNEGKPRFFGKLGAGVVIDSRKILLEEINESDFVFNSGVVDKTSFAMQSGVGCSYPIFKGNSSVSLVLDFTYNKKEKENRFNAGLSLGLVSYLLK